MTRTVLPVYSLDASALFDLFDYYPADRFGPIWTGLDELIKQGRLIMVEQAVGECLDPNSSAWLRTRRSIIVRFSPELNDCMLEIMADLTAASLMLVNPRKTRNEADPFVIAAAIAYNRQINGGNDGPTVVLSSEKAAPENATNVKIPNVCARYKIRCMNLLEMMREENWRFSSFD